MTLHDGSELAPEDVLLSYGRANSDQSDVSSWFAPVSEVIVVDDHTVDVMTAAPNPIFPDTIVSWMIIDKEWSGANDNARPGREQENFVTLNANGTGAYRLESRQPGYSSARVDGLLPEIQSGIDGDVRQEMLDEVANIIGVERPIPLYVQPLFWGAKENL